MVRIAYFCILAAIACAQPPPDATEIRALIPAIRANALSYSSKLPNFICTQQTRRTVDYSGTGSQWKKLDTIEQQLTYFGLRENYKLISVNGKPPKQKNPIGMGVRSSGEFGSMLDQLFQLDAGANFTWLRWETINGRPIHVFSVLVDKSRSLAKVSVPGQEIIVGYHGEIFADPDTKAIVRLVIHADIPPAFPLQDISHVIDYGLTLIGGDEFLLPLHTEMRVRLPESMLRDGVARLRARTVLTRNQTDFLLYKRYVAETKINFDP